MLTLKNFETQAPSKLLERAREYYQNGAVTSLEETEKNLWEAEVEGNEPYRVEIKLKNNGQVEEWFCNCPFEGDLCKHVLATLFAIKKVTDEPESTGPKKFAKIAFGNLLKKISLTEYRDFISQYAAKNKTFKTEFEIWFADKDGQIDLSKNYESLIKKCIQNYSNRGFVDYRAGLGLSRELEKILDVGDSFVKKNNYRGAFAVAKPLLMLTVEVMTCSDDSNGSIGGVINGAIELIGNIIETDGAAIELKERIYDFLQTELSNKIYFDYGDFGYDLFSMFSKLSAQLNKEAGFISLIDKLSAAYNDKYDSYARQFFQRQKIAFYESAGNKTEAEKLIEENINIVEVRAGLVNKAIGQKDFSKAKKLIADGIKIAQSNGHPGTVAQWEKALLQIAFLEKDLPAIRSFSKKLAFDGWFEASYYKQWKKTYTPGEWPGVIESYINDTIGLITREHEKDKNRPWYSPNPPLLSKLAPVYIEEKYWDRLLALVKKEKQLNAVWPYHEYLAPAFPSELVSIYLNLFAGEADAANTRSAYADLAHKMKKVIKDIPAEKERIMALARSMQLTYNRRPAMVEELNKVLK